MKIRLNAIPTTVTVSVVASLAYVLFVVTGERDAAQKEMAEIATQCAVDLMAQRQELNHEMAEFYFEKAADVFQCAEDICRGNGWTEPPEWGVDDWVPTPDWEDVEEEAAREK